jgi:hypothetical protein
MFSQNSNLPKSAVFRGEIDIREVAEPSEIMLGSIRHGEFDLREAIKLEFAREDGRCVMRWRETNIQVSGATHGEALEQLRRVILQRANEPHIERFLKPRFPGNQIRAFKRAEG